MKKKSRSSLYFDEAVDIEDEDRRSSHLDFHREGYETIDVIRSCRRDDFGTAFGFARDDLDRLVYEIVFAADDQCRIA